MTPDVPTVSPDTTIAQALSVCREHRLRHLPVLRDGRLVGLVTDRDLRLGMPPIWAEDQVELQHLLRTRTVGEVMSTDLVTTSPDLPIEEAGRLLYSNHIGCVPVMEGDELIGLLTETDLVRSFVELFHTGGPSSRVEVRMPNRPGELARVVRVIGIEHRINITGMVMPPSEGGDGYVAIMHLATLDAAPIVIALRKLGYEVGWPSLDLPAALTVEQSVWDNEQVPLIL
jgi:acetoin utilization protein AcuB